jgi:hypothetical protein
VKTKDVLKSWLRQGTAHDFNIDKSIRVYDFEVRARTTRYGCGTSSESIL